MKLRSIAFIIANLLMLASTSLLAKPIVFIVEIANATEAQLGIYFRPSPEAAPKYYRNNIRENGESVFELDIPFEQFITLEYDSKKIPVYVQLDDRPRIQFDAQAISKTLKFSGTGSENNNFMAAFNREFRKRDKMTFEVAYMPYDVANGTSKKATTHTDQQFFLMRDERLSSELQFIDNQGLNVKSSILDYYRTDAKYNDLVERITYFTTNQDYLEAAQIETLKERWNIISDTKYKNENLLEHPMYRNYLRAALHYHYAPAKEFVPRRAAPLLYDLIEEKFERKAKAYLQATLLVNFINRSGDPSFGQERFAEFQKKNNYSEYNDLVEKTYGSTLNTLATASAPQLFFEKENGEYGQLYDYKGQVVYISFWASWCKPCLKNFQKSEKIRREMQEMGVVLLNVSIDESAAAFEESLERQPILGLNVLASDLDETKISYQLSTIPAYYIIDKEGKFAFLPQTDNRNILGEFKKLVKE